MPGDEYIALTMRSGVPGLASAGFATSPAASPRSSFPASSSGTFSLLPFVFCVLMRSVASCAFTISANASPKSGKPPPGVAVPSIREITSSFIARLLRLDLRQPHDLAVDLGFAAHEARELFLLHGRGLDAELRELLAHQRLEHDRVHGAVQLLHQGRRRGGRRPHSE